MRTLRSPLGALLFVALCLMSCAESKPGPAPEPSYQPLVELDDWAELGRDEDPLITDAAAAPACTAPGFRVEAEQNWVEIDTTHCGWVTLTAHARAPVAEGQMLQVKFSHYDLNAAAPAEADASVVFGACVAWSKAIPIPSPADVNEEELASPCALREGDPLLFHLNNHGQNTYQLQAISSLR